jgi:recombination protein RecA
MANAVVSVQSLVKQYQKDFGNESIKYGGNLVDSERIPTGVFPFDLMLGGGFPRSRVSILWGKESSNKTNLALMAIANHQRLWPLKTCVFVDVEHSFDPEWARQLGVDTESLVVAEAAFAEQLIDMIEGLLVAVDMGLMVIDSLAAMITTQEGEADASNNRPGGGSLIVGKLIRKVTIGLSEANKAKNYPTVIYINQTRQAIGSYGNPDKMPGGNAPYFQANLIIKVIGKNIMDAKINKSLPVYKEVSAKIIKSKTPVLAQYSKFNMIMVAFGKFKVGDTDDWETIKGYLENLGHFGKKEKGVGYAMLGEEYATLKACEDKILDDREYGAEVRRELISALTDNKEMIIIDDEKPEK